MKRTSSAIRDGYTRRGYIYSDGNHDGLEFKYRPMLPDAVDDLLAKTKNCDPKQRVPIIAGFVAPYITEWSEWKPPATGEIGDGTAMEITPATVATLPWPLLSRVEGIITGFSYSDLAPDYTPDELERFTKMKAGDRKWPGAEEAAADRKN